MSKYKDYVEVEYIFKGKAYKLVMMVNSGSSISIRLEDSESLEDWSGEFDSTYIEELTKKTGNFKNFDVFAAMLQTVMLESTSSLNLELMTYADLEELRRLKTHHGSNGTAPATSAPSSVQGQSASHNKRFLILEYTTQFDRIYYPLPLQYEGRPTVAQLKQQVNTLRTEISRLRQGDPGDWRKLEVEELRHSMRSLREENAALQGEVARLRSQVAVNVQAEQLQTEMRHEMAALRSIVSNLEDELSEERSRAQHSSQKRVSHQHALERELEELRASERNMRLRLKSLTNELNFYKRRPPTEFSSRGYLPPTSHLPPPPTTFHNKRASSLDRGVTTPRQLRGASPTPSATLYGLETLNRRPLSSTGSRASSSSARQSPRSSRDRGGAGAIPHRGDGSSSARTFGHIRTHSWDAGGRRFNPTEYVIQQEIKKQELKSKKERDILAMQRLGAGDSASERDSWLGASNTTGKRVSRRDQHFTVNGRNSDREELDSLASSRGSRQHPPPVSRKAQRPTTGRTKVSRNVGSGARHTFSRVMRSDDEIETVSEDSSSGDVDADMVRRGPGGRKSVFQRPRLLNEGTTETHLDKETVKNGTVLSTSATGVVGPPRTNRTTRYSGKVTNGSISSLQLEKDDIDKRLGNLNDLIQKFLRDS